MRPRQVKPHASIYTPNEQAEEQARQDIAMVGADMVPEAVAELSLRVNEAHQRAEGAAHSALEYAREAGECLMKEYHRGGDCEQRAAHHITCENSTALRVAAE